MDQSLNIKSKLVEDYWLDKLEASATAEGERMGIRHDTTVMIPFSSVERISALGKGSIIATHTIYLACFAAMLQRYAGDQFTLIAMPDINRESHMADASNIFFIRPGIVMEDLLRNVIFKVQKEIQESVKHAIPLIRLQQGIQERSITGNPYRYAFSYDATNGAFSCSGESEISLHLKTTEHGINAVLTCDDSTSFYFPAGQFLEAWATLIANLPKFLDQPWHSIRPEQETAVTKGGTPAVREGGVVMWFDQQVKKHAQRQALKYNNVELTYAELAEKVARVATYLRTEAGICRGDIVGILMDRSEMTIISILGVLKAGGAFLPLDPKNPRERTQFILEDAAVKMLIVTSEFLYDLQFFAGHILALDIQLDLMATDDIETERFAETPAYVIYTSGTTGMPKGVAIPDGAIANYADWFIRSFGIDENDNAVLLSSPAFDLGYTSIWGTLLSGGCLHILPESSLHDPGVMADYFAENQITYLKTSPSLFALFEIVMNFEHPCFAGIRLILLGGEPLHQERVRKFTTRHPHTVMVNHYGPTETTIGTITNRIAEESSYVIIGTPIDNQMACIIDENCHILPPGLKGELCIGGKGLALGYVNRPRLSADKFIMIDGIRFYRTGDEALQLPDGRIAFVGRKDQQVKISGYRVEPREVEYHLRRFGGISDALIVPRSDRQGSIGLVAYFLSGEKTDLTELRSYLTDKLPLYMIPAHFIQLKKWPLTLNGKLDLQALPDIPQVSTGDERYIAPAGETELRLAEVWKEVLQAENVGVQDNFFELGGNSLKVVRVFKIINDEYPDALKIVDLFDHPTIRWQAAAIDEKTGNTQKGKSAINVVEF